MLPLTIDISGLSTFSNSQTIKRDEKKSIKFEAILNEAQRNKIHQSLKERKDLRINGNAVLYCGQRRIEKGFTFENIGIKGVL